MGTFNAKILAEFQPPRKWKLGRDLTYSTKNLMGDEIKALQDIGVKVNRDTDISPVNITVPTEFMTDLASTPRVLWAFIAPFDVARAAIVHDLLYKTIRQYRWNKGDIEEDKEFTELHFNGDEYILNLYCSSLYKNKRVNFSFYYIDVFSGSQKQVLDSQHIVRFK